MSCKLCEGVGEIDTLGHQTVACPECVERDLEAKIERLKEENAKLRAWREIGFALWHAASPDSDDEIGRKALSRFLLAVDKQLEAEAEAAKGEVDA